MSHLVPSETKISSAAMSQPRRLEVVLGDRLAQEVVALLGAVAVERVAAGHLVDGLVHRLDDRGRQRLGDVADAHADDLGDRDAAAANAFTRRPISGKR